MLISDRVLVEGRIKLRAYEILTGRTIYEFEDHNIVVNSGRNALAHLIGGDTATWGSLDSWVVDTLKFGDGGHDPNDPTVLIPGDVTYGNLQGTVWGTTPVVASYPNEREVTFRGILGSAEGNGPNDAQALSEIGLFYNAGALMFSYKAFGYVVKTPNIEIEVLWTFVF